LYSFGQFCDAYLPIVDGVVMVVKNYTEVLNQKYGKCCVVAPKVPHYEDTEPFEVVRVNSLPIPQRYPYRFAVPELHKTSIDSIRAIKLDLIHTHSPFGLSQYGMKIAKRRNIPIISTFHSKYYDDFKQVVKLDSLAQIGVNLIVEYYKRMDQVWTCSKSTAETLREYGYKGNIEVILNGSDTKYPEDAQTIRDKTREKYKIPAGMPVFLFVGQHIWQKNIKTLILSMAYLKKSGFAFKMIMTGKGYAEDDIKKMVKEEGMEDNFIFTGPVMDREELSGLYLLSDLFVFPSIYDNAPLVVKEAAGLRTPSLIIDGSNASEGIKDSENGFLIEDNCDKIGEKIIEIYGENIDLTKIGENAEKTLSLSWENIVDDVYGRYVELIKYKNRKK